MTKRLTITLVALALFVLIAVLPASAMSANPATGLFNGSVILNGTPTPTVFIGETGLNLTRVLYSGAGDGYGGLNSGVGDGGPYVIPTKIGWWAPGTFSYPANPSAVIDVASRFTRFDVGSNDFGPYLGNWYCLTADNHGNGLAFIVADPNQIVSVWDIRASNGQGADMTGKSVVRGSVLSVKVDTNLAAFTVGGRGNQISNWTNGSVVLADTLAVGGGAAITPNTYTAPPGNENGRWSNGTVSPRFDVPGGANAILTYSNFSFTRMTWGAMNVTRTYIYNNTDPSLFPGGANIWGGGLFVQGTTGVASNTLATAPFAETYYAMDNRTGQGITQAVYAQLFAPSANSADGFITIRLKDESGQVHTQVYTNQLGTAVTPLQHRWVFTQPWFLGNFDGISNGLAAGTIGWQTDAIDAGLGTNAYPAGTYTVWSESTLSKMRDTYKLNGADYTGKTVSAAGTVTLVSDTVKIQANKETVVRSKPFSVTITGRPLTQYFVWVKGTSSLNGGYDQQPPMVALFQSAVYNDTPGGGGNGNAVGSYALGQYVFQNAACTGGVCRVIRGVAVPYNGDVATDTAVDAAGLLVNPYGGSRYYAQINTTASGTRTVEFVTTNMTKAQTYTIRVEQNFPITTSGFPTVQRPTAIPNDDYKADEVDVKVEKGAVTITAAGDQSYYLGEEIKFSGTNTETQVTYLFITGPNLWPTGSRLNQANLDPRRLVGPTSFVNSRIPGDFIQRPVAADNTWDWKWGTASWALDAGTYTIYAVSGPENAGTLANVAYGTVAIIIKKPFISATASQSTVAQGDKLFITGTAEGKPQQGVAIWIMGKNYAQRVTESVNADASFSYEVTTATTTNMDAGQYFIVAQHPMTNQQFDVDMCVANPFKVCNLQQGTAALATEIFTLLGQGSLQGTDAAEALVQGINSPNVDDTYTKLVFLVEVPSIRIDPVGDRHVGDKFTITATTNLAVDDDVQMTVVSSSFKPTQKSQSGEFSGASGTVKVTKGDTGLNKLSFDVDASTFKPDEYIVTANRILLPAATATALFNVLEGAAPTAVPTKVVTAAPTAAAPTTVATAVPTATPTKTPTQPGFGALVALIGLGAVAFFVVRRH